MYCCSFCVTATTTRPAACSGTTARNSVDERHAAGTLLVLKRACVYPRADERREKPAPTITMAAPPERGAREGASSSRRTSDTYSKRTSSAVKSSELRDTSSATRPTSACGGVITSSIVGLTTRAPTSDRLPMRTPNCSIECSKPVPRTRRRVPPPTTPLTGSTPSTHISTWYANDANVSSAASPCTRLTATGRARTTPGV